MSPSGTERDVNAWACRHPGTIDLDQGEYRQARADFLLDPNPVYRSMTRLLRNAPGATVRCEVRLFNSLSGNDTAKSAGAMCTLPAGASLADLLQHLGTKPREVFLVLVNGRDITRSLHGPVRTDYAIQDGDVVALSGPVPYSFGYGAPVV